MQTVFEVFLGNICRSLFQYHKVDARNRGSVVIGTATNLPVGKVDGLACRSHLHAVVVRTLVGTLINDAVASSEELHGLGEVYHVGHIVARQRSIGLAAYLSRLRFWVGRTAQVFREVLMEGIPVVLRFDEHLFYLQIANSPRFMLTPSKELHLIISTHSSKPAPGTS